MTRTILVDADLLAYVASAATQRSYDFNEDGSNSFVSADLDEAMAAVEESLRGLIERLQPDDLIICLSDDVDSFRKQLIDPSYKSNRTAERPLQLYPLKDWMRDTYIVEERSTLEADDVMGIIATDPSRSDERIIVSADKDMMTIPGKLYRPQLQTGAKKPVILDITEEEAWRFHFWQAIVGDTTDGYPGAYKVGAKSLYAEAVLEAEDPEDAWEWVIAAHHKAGGDELTALTQARLARILHHEDYDGSRPILWLPPYSGER